jgi:hypothetical protein
MAHLEARLTMSLDLIHVLGNQRFPMLTFFLSFSIYIVYIQKVSVDEFVSMVFVVKVRRNEILKNIRELRKYLIGKV